MNAPCSLGQLVLYFLKLGTIGFGGPVALVGYMYRDLVESRRWIDDDDYKEGLTLAQLMPGPLAAQLAMYLTTYITAYGPPPWPAFVQQDDSDHYRTVSTIQTSPGARTGLFVAARNALYVAVPGRAAAPAEIRVYAAQ